MATPTLLSVSNVALGNTADSGNVSVTAPTGANACVIGGTFYVGDNSVVTSLTGSQLTSTTNGALKTATPSGGNYMSSYAGAFQVTATGSQTIRLQKTGGYSEGPTCQIAWLTVDDPTDFVRTSGFLIDTQASSPDTLSVALASATTDLVLGIFGTDGSSSDPSAPSGTTQQGTLQTTQFDKSIVFSVDSPGASTTTITVGSRAYPTLIGISLKAGGGGATTHATTGALVGPGSTVAGSAAHIAVHGTTGALTGPGSSIVGSAARTRAHPTSGALSGPGSLIVGSARHNAPHPTSGDLTGPGSVVSGSAARTRVHPSTGDLVGQGSEVVGSAARTRVHPSSGALTGPGSEIAGSAARTRVHPSSGALVGPGAQVVGDADHQGAAGTHDTTGTLVGQGSAVAGSAARLRAFAASGALVGQGSAIAGSAARVAGPVSHATSGALVGAGSAVAGSAARTSPAVSHDTSGALVGPGSLLNGQAQIGDSIIDTHDGFWVREWKKMVEREKKLSVEEVMEIVEEAPKEVLEAIPEVKKQVKKEFGRVDYQRIANNLQMQRFIAEQILVRHEIRMQELEEDDLEVLLLL